MHVHMHAKPGVTLMQFVLVLVLVGACVQFHVKAVTTAGPV